MIDLDELEKLAKAATPDSWAIAIAAGHGGQICHARGPDHPRPNSLDWHPLAIADAEFIYAANPAVVLKLLSRLKAAEAVCALAEPLLKDYCELHDNPTKHELFTEPMEAALDAWRAAGGK